MALSRFTSISSLLLSTPLTLLFSHVYSQIPDYETLILGQITTLPYIRPCLVYYFDSYGCGATVTDLPSAVGCSYNTCLCRRTDVRTSASVFLESCVSQKCKGNPDDVGDAHRAFTEYCEGYLSVVGVTGTDEGGRVTVTDTVALVTSFVTRISTVYNGKQGSSAEIDPVSESDGLDTSGKISLGVGLGIGIPALGLLGFIVYILLKRKNGGDISENVVGTREINVKTGLIENVAK